MCLSHAFVCGNEDYDSWKVFLAFVKQCYPHLDMAHLTVVSDQDKGIKRAVTEVTPSLGHFYCSKHRSDNVKLRCNLTCKEAFLHAADARSLDELALTQGRVFTQRCYFCIAAAIPK
ncbi:MAG: hypothetical protein ACREOZ_00820 [Gloeomargaritales cyanobacterium]